MTKEQDEQGRRLMRDKQRDAITIIASDPGGGGIIRDDLSKLAAATLHLFDRFEEHESRTGSSPMGKLAPSYVTAAEHHGAAYGPDGLGVGLPADISKPAATRRGPPPGVPDYSRRMQAVSIAVEAAEADRIQTYTQARPFVPHEWVIRAVTKALEGAPMQVPRTRVRFDNGAEEAVPYDATTAAIARLTDERNLERQRVLELVRERDEAVRQRESYAEASAKARALLAEAEQQRGHLQNALDADRNTYSNLRALVLYPHTNLPIVEALTKTIAHYTDDRDSALRKANGDMEAMGARVLQLERDRDAAVDRAITAEGESKDLTRAFEASQRKLAALGNVANLVRACDEEFTHLPVLNAAEQTIGRLRQALAEALGENTAKLEDAREAEAKLRDIGGRLEHALARCRLADAEWNAARVCINPVIAKEFDGQTLADAVVHTVQMLEAKLQSATEAGQRAHDDAVRVQKLLQADAAPRNVDELHRTRRLEKLEKQRGGHLSTIADQGRQILELREALATARSNHAAHLSRQVSTWEHERSEGAKQVQRLIAENQEQRIELHNLRSQAMMISPREHAMQGERDEARKERRFAIEDRERAHKLLSEATESLERLAMAAEYKPGSRDDNASNVLAQLQRWAESKGKIKTPAEERLLKEHTRAWALIDRKTEPGGRPYWTDRDADLDAAVQLVFTYYDGKIADAQATIGKQATTCASFRERVLQLEAQLANLHKLLENVSAQSGQLRDRVYTIADEAFGPFPVLEAEEACTAIELGITHQRFARQRGDRFVDCIRAWLDNERGLDGVREALAAHDKDQAEWQTKVEAEQLEFLRSAGKRNEGDCQSGTCDCPEPADPVSSS